VRALVLWRPWSPRFSKVAAQLDDAEANWLTSVLADLAEARYLCKDHNALLSWVSLLVAA